MIVLCNGLAKSGSSFIFQIAESLAESTGFAQESLRDQYIPAEFIPYKPHPHFVSFPPEELNRWVESVSTTQTLVVKTHDPFTPEMEELLAAGKIKVLNSYRNPRDAAVSLWDSALKERLIIDRSKWRFGIPTFQASIMIVAHLANINAHWMKNRHTLNVGFHEITESPFEVAKNIADHLQLEDNSFSVVSTYLKNRNRIREYNIGLSGRHMTYMSLFEEGWSNRIYRQYDKLIAAAQHNSSS